MANLRSVVQDTTPRNTELHQDVAWNIALCATPHYKRDVTDTPPAALLYEAVDEAIKRTGLTKVQVHRRSGVARSTIDGWKTRMTPPHASTVLSVARVVGISDDEALRLAGLKGPQPVPPADLAEVPTDDLLAEIRRRIEDR